MKKYHVRYVRDDVNDNSIVEAVNMRQAIVKALQISMFDIRMLDVNSKSSRYDLFDSSSEGSYMGFGYVEDVTNKTEYIVGRTWTSVE